LTGNSDLHGTGLTLGAGLTGGNNNLTLDFSTAVTLPDGITGVNNFTASKAVNINGSFTTAGTQTYTGAVTLTGNSTLTGASENFAGITGGGNNLTVSGNATYGTVSGVAILSNTGSATFNGAANIGTLNEVGVITQTAPITVSGTTTIASGAGNNIILNNIGNDFGTVIITSGNNVTLTDKNALNFGTSTVSGMLNVTTGGSITQTAATAIAVAGTTTLAAGNGNNITLNNAGNDFSTVSIASGNNVTLADKNALVLGTSTVSGALTVTASGAITQAGPVAVTGTTTLAAGTGNDITLSNTGNVFSTVAVTSGSDVVLTGSTSVDLGPVNISGGLTVSANGGNITESGSVAALWVVASASNDVRLTSTNNNIGLTGTGYVTGTAGGSFALSNTNTLWVGGTTTDGHVLGGITSTSGTGNVSIQVSGTASNLVLNGVLNDPNGSVTGSSGCVLIVTGDQKNVGSMTLSGSAVQAFGNITAKTGDLKFEAQNLLVLSGTSYAAAGTLGLNDAIIRTGTGTDLLKTSILLTSTNLVALSGANIEMGALVGGTGALTSGLYQCLVAIGALEIKASNTVVLGDVAVSGTLNVTGAQNIYLMDRTAVSAGDPLSRPDRGLSIMAGNIFGFNALNATYQDSKKLFVELTGTHGSGTAYVSSANQRPDPGANLFLYNLSTHQNGSPIIRVYYDPNLQGEFGTYRTIATTLQTPLDFKSLATVLATLPDQPHSDGLAVIPLFFSPFQSVGLPVVNLNSDDLSDAVLERLRDMSIDARLATNQEQSDMLNLQGLFLQKGTKVLKPDDKTDYDVVVHRISRNEAESAVELYNELFGKTAEEIPQKISEIGGDISQAYDAYLIDTNATDAAGFGAYLVSKGGTDLADKAVGRLAKFKELFDHLEKLGLTRKEIEISEQKIVGQLGLAQPDPGELVQLIKASKLPVASIPPSPAPADGGNNKKKTADNTSASHGG